MKNILLISLLFVGLFSSCNKSATNETIKPTPKTPLVKVQPAMKSKMVSFIDLTGTVQPNILSEVKSPIDGVIDALYVRENDFVNKDQIIAVINPNERLTLIADNQFQINKIERLIEKTKDKSEESDSLLIELKRAKDNLEYAKKMYKAIPVISPMSGMVTARLLDAGSQVSSKEKVIVISDMHSLVIKAEINEKYFEAITQGKKIPVILNAYHNDTLSGIISLVYPQIDPLTRSVKFDVKVQTNNKKLLPGMMATLRIPVSVNENAITVNPDAILTGPDNKSFLFVADNDSIVYKRNVTTGISTETKTEITKGIKEKEIIVVKGQEMLKDSVKVKIMKNK